MFTYFLCLNLNFGHISNCLGSDDKTHNKVKLREKEKNVLR